MKILVIQQKMIGDVLTSSILFEALRQEYPKAQLDYLINEHTFPVVENSPFIDNFIFFTKVEEKSKTALFKFAKSIRHKNYDIVIDVYSKFSSNLISLLSRATIKISKHKWYSSFIYTATFKDFSIKQTIAGLAIENRVQLLKALNFQTEPYYKPQIFLSEKEIEASKLVLEANGIDFSKPLFMIGVLGSDNTKTYPFEYMANIIDTITIETKGQVLFNYIPNQKNDAQKIYDLCNKKTQEYIFFNLFGKSLREFLAITHHCSALIGNEGGATNMAKALNKPTFTIFSPWIDKNAWNMFDNENTNVSVHLREYLPENYTKINKYKELKQDAHKLYKQFEPVYFKDIFKKFLRQF